MLRSGGQRIDVVLMLILLGALAVRIELALTRDYVHDEINTAIPLAQSISFDPARLNLPLRAVNHPALPAYFVKLSSTVFGVTPLGYRAVHILAGLLTIVAVYLLTRQAFGQEAARCAAAVLAFDEYFMGISSRATAHAPYLLFVTLAIYAFGRFVVAERPVFLYATAVSVALAFLCKEHSALLLPLFLATLLLPSYRHWLTRAPVYLSCALFALMIAPDVLWNLRADPSAHLTTYGDHLDRIGGVGFSPYPLMFYGRGPVSAAYLLITGEPLDDNTSEYDAMNPAAGAILVGSVLLATASAARPVGIRVYLLILFWGIFGFFSMIRRGNPEGLDPVSWIWADVSMIPAAVLSGSWLAGLRGRLRLSVWVLAAGALLYAVLWMVFPSAVNFL